MESPRRARRPGLLGLCLLTLAACGGGDGNDISAGPANPTWTQGSYPASSTFAAHCAAPRTGIDPATNRAYPDTKGSATWENFWLRSWTHELYLWYREVPDVNPATYSSTEAYFALLKTSATTSTGKAKDRFHFTYNTADWVAYSQSGVSAGYGAEWIVLQGTPPRQVVVAFTEPGSPAVSAGLTRGVQVLTVDGVDLVNDNTTAGVNTLNAALWPSSVNEQHTLTIRELNGTTRSITLTSANITSTPVQNVTVLPTGSGNVGYLLFNDHIASAEQPLINAFTQLQNAAVTDLVLDLRYNGGGYLVLASEVAYMIAGQTATAGRTFERMAFNDQYATNVNPVTGDANTPMLFVGTSSLSSPSVSLPALNLSRVFVLTGRDTCSASESIINGLRGIGLQVIQVGSTTCGKPYGFYPEDNCGTTYFSIQIQGLNNAGFGDYPDGFSSQNTTGYPGVLLPGCSVADDFTHTLGDPAEGRLAATLFYRNNQFCNVSASGSGARVKIQSATDLSAADGLIPKQPWRENRILVRR